MPVGFARFQGSLATAWHIHLQVHSHNKNRLSQKETLRFRYPRHAQTAEARGILREGQ